MTEEDTTSTFLAALALGAGIGVLRGGRIKNVADIRLRMWPLLLAGVAIQLTLGLLPTAARWGLVVLCCALVGGWLALNMRAPGMRSGMGVLLAGVVANTVVIAANRGMPVAARALVLSGRSAHTDLAHGFLYKHHLMTAHSSLTALGDRLPLPGIREVLSPGDVLMLVGLALMAYGATRPRTASARWRRRRAREGGGPETSAPMYQEAGVDLYMA